MIKDKGESKKVVLVALSHSSFTGGIQRYNLDLLDAISTFSQIANVAVSYTHLTLPTTYGV